MRGARLIFLLFLLSVCLGENYIVSINWDNVTYVSQTTVTLQVVVNPYILRGSPIHNGTFTALANLQADYVRFVPWFPYPQYAVAELRPPGGNPNCASIVANESLYLQCYDGVFQSFDFASLGTPDGSCGGFSVGACHSNVSLQIVEKYCLGRGYCQINITEEIFGDPCPGQAKWFSVQGTCSNPADITFWNFTLIDPLMEDFMNATNNHSVIINFSTIPSWMWNTPSPVLYPDDPNTPAWSYEAGLDLRDPSMRDLANYYQRLVGWYTRGGFYDEYANFHESNHFYNIPMWEILNEIDFEHDMSPEFYTQIYDAIAGAILEIQPEMQFVGLALETRDPAYFEYFLNESNHKPGIPIHYISYHFYVSATSRSNVTTFEDFFAQADEFFGEAADIQNIVAKLNPTVKTTLDEVGAILPDDNSEHPKPIAHLYWNAAGCTYAYIVANLIPQGIAIIGQSQLVGYPTQYPSVSMMNWHNGKPNAKYWILHLLHESFHVSDRLVETSWGNTTNMYAQGFLTAGGRKVLVLNKTIQPMNVTLEYASVGFVTYVDGTTFDNPPKSRDLNPDGSFLLNPFGVAVVSLPF